MLPLFPSGKLPRVDALNNAVESINQNLPITAGKGVGINQTAGTHIRSMGKTGWSNHAITVGKIVATGPLGSEGDFTNCLYWVKLQENQLSSGHSLVTESPNLGDVANHTGLDATDNSIVIAVSFSEIIADSHSMYSVDDIIELMPIKLDVPTSFSGACITRWAIIGGVAGESKGQHQYQVRQMVTDTTTGWDYTRGAPNLDTD